MHIFTGKNRGSITAIAAAILFCSLYCKTSYAQHDTVTVSPSSLQTVKGWGCNSFFAAPSVPAEVTRAFYGELGMTIDRIYLDHNDGLNDLGAVNPAAMDDVCKKIASLHRFGLRYILCSWSPAVGMKNPAIVASADLREDREGAFTSYFVNICKFISQKHLPLPIAITLQNEPTNTATYDSMHFVNQNNFDYTQYYRVVLELRRKLDQSGFRSVKLLGPEDGSYDTGKSWGCSLAFLGGNGFPVFRTNPALRSAIWGCSSHSYNWGGTVNYLEQWAASCNRWHKDKWMTEYSYIENGEKNTPLIDIAVMSARRLCSDMECVQNNYWFWWDGYAPGIARNEVLMSDDGKYTKYPLFYVLQKIFTNVPPGSVCHPVTSNDPDFDTSSSIWMNAAAFETHMGMTVVLVNPHHATTLNMNLAGVEGKFATVYQTTGDKNMQVVAGTRVVNGGVPNLRLPPWSVTVILTSQKAAVVGASSTAKEVPAND